MQDGSRYCDRSRENGRRFGVKRHIGYGWGARASRRLRLGTGQGERFGCGVRRGECPTALSDSCVLSPSCAYSANTLPLSGSASMAVARPLRGRRGRDEVRRNRHEAHDVQKWRALRVRRVRRGMRPVVGFRQVSFLDRRSGVSSSEHEDRTVLSLAVAEAALRRCGGSGPRSENGLRHGTYRPFGNRPWPEAWERPIRPGRWRVA